MNKQLVHESGMLSCLQLVPLQVGQLNITETMIEQDLPLCSLQSMQCTHDCFVFVDPEMSTECNAEIGKGMVNQLRIQKAKALY